MKVGTDGVLLGAWTPLPSTAEHSSVHILDIGTGSGLIALMLAQRCPEATVEGIDIDRNAVEQARENFEQAAFSCRLSAFHSSLQNWQMTNDQEATTGEKYDLIVSNPPYFQNSLKNPNEGRRTARHTDTLSYEELFFHGARLLAPNGTFALILPAEAEKEILLLATAAGLTLTHRTRVYSKESKPARRVLLAFAKEVENTSLGSPCTLPIVETTLVLEDDKGGRSRQYQELCEEFYL